jgi:hypothetical protein
MGGGGRGLPNTEAVSFHASLVSKSADVTAVQDGYTVPVVLHFRSAGAGGDSAETFGQEYVV